MSGAPIPALLLIGCGRMGSALLAGWIGNGLAASVVVDPAVVSVPAPHRSVASLDALPAGFAPEAVVLAVKPQMAPGVLAGLAERHPNALFVSIMAGLTIGSLSRASGAMAWVRAMPNLPASVGRGATAAVTSAHVSALQKANAGRLFEAVGRLTWLDDEALLDAVTAVSGSGPAYVFLLAEALERAGMRAGLPAAIARLLARETVVGAGSLLAADDTDARLMREAVTSKAGTTEQALAVLMRQGGLVELIEEAVARAAERSRELAS